MLKKYPNLQYIKGLVAIVAKGIVIIDVCVQKSSQPSMQNLLLLLDKILVLINLGVMDSPVPLNSNSSQRSQIVVLVLLQV